MKKIVFIISFLAFISCNKSTKSVSVSDAVPLQEADTNLYTGSLIEYYAEGTSRKFVEVYQGGVKNGNFTSWYKSGQLKVVGKFAENRRTGTWKWYTENGELEYSFVYKA